LQKPGDDGIEDYADPAGQKFSLPTESIETREASTTSIMPDGLEKVISIADLRDLVTFLATPLSPAPMIQRHHRWRRSGRPTCVAAADALSSKLVEAGRSRKRRHS